MIFRRTVVRQRAIIRADKHFVAMLTFCGEIIAVRIITIILRRRRRRRRRRRLEQVMKNSFDFTSDLPQAHQQGSLNHYIQIITLLKMQTSGPRILLGYHYVDAVSTLELL